VTSRIQHPDSRSKRTATLLILLIASCGKESPKDPLDTADYNEWKQSQILRRLPMARGGLELRGRIDVYPPDQRSKNPNDFCEIFMNGERLGKWKTGKLPDGSWPRISLEVDWNSGPNTFDLWDSTSNRYYRQQVDTRECIQFTCVPSAEGYDIQMVKKTQD
jgi:hypothetical protein